jgi:hypothetical protein
MNIAFPALVVLLLLLPGVLLSYSYRRGFFRRSPVTLGPIREEIGRGIVLALFIHPIALLIASWVTGWLPDTVVLTSLFVADADPTTASTEVVNGLWYLVIVNVGALMVGSLAHWVVRANRLDLRYDFLRFDNEWHYLFSGEARIFKVDQAERTITSIKNYLSHEFEFVFVSVVVTVGDQSVLYWGVLSDYFFDASGQLDKVVLKDAQRRLLQPETDDVSAEAATPIQDERFYPIRGSFLVIRYANVQTLNVGYYIVRDEEE